MEICTLFGNCLYNAIEAVSDLPVKNRDIRISGGEVNQNIVINISNPFAHPLQQQENRFATTKKDKAHHGYGLLNVCHVVESHDGTLTFQTENACFRVCWMIPIPKSKRYQQRQTTYNNSKISPRYNNREPETSEPKDSGAFLCLEVNIFVIPYRCYHYHYRILKRSRAERKNAMNFWPEIIKEVGTVLIDVLVLIAEEIENND